MLNKWKSKLVHQSISRKAAECSDTLVLTGSALSKLERVPEQVRECASLTLLNLSYNNISSVLLEPLARLARLRVLDLSYNRVSYVEEALGDSLGASLLRLELTSNELEEVPPALFHLVHLQELSLEKNALSALPPDMCRHMTSLRILSLVSNQLQELPPNLGDLFALTHLFVAHNRVRQVPDSVSRLAALHTLGLQHNALDSALPAALTSLPSLKELLLSDNPAGRDALLALSDAPSLGLVAHERATNPMLKWLALPRNLALLPQPARAALLDGSGVLLVPPGVFFDATSLVDAPWIERHVVLLAQLDFVDEERQQFLLHERLHRVLRTGSLAIDDQANDVTFYLVSEPLPHAPPEAAPPEAAAAPTSFDAYWATCRKQRSALDRWARSFQRKPPALQQQPAHVRRKLHECLAALQDAEAPFEPHELRTKVYRVILQSVYKMVGYSSDTLQQDAKLFTLVSHMSLFVTPAHLDLPVFSDASTDHWATAAEQLKLINSVVLPSEKLRAIMSCVNSISFAIAQDNEVVSADALLPNLIYVVLRANPAYFACNLQFIRNYALDGELEGETFYHYTNVVSAMEYLLAIDHAALNLDLRQFMRLTKSPWPRAAEASELSHEARDRFIRKTPKDLRLTDVQTLLSDYQLLFTALELQGRPAVKRCCAAEVPLSLKVRLRDGDPLFKLVRLPHRSLAELNSALSRKFSTPENVLLVSGVHLLSGIPVTDALLRNMPVYTRLQATMVNASDIKGLPTTRHQSFIQ